ncbi:Hydrogenase 2 maturation protease [uncultured Gammaproteobacteria bacterium]
MTVLVLGLGNILLRDEGLGVRVVEALEQRYRVPSGVTVLDGGTSGMDLLDSIAGTGDLIVVDAIRAGRAPGELVRLTGEQVPVFFRQRLSPHQLGLSDLLATLALQDQSPASVTILGCEPLDLALGLELSPTVAARIDDLVAAVVAEVASLGYSMEPGSA